MNFLLRNGLPMLLALSACSQQAPTTASPAPMPAETRQTPSPKPVLQLEGTPAETVMTPEYVAMVGRFAYLWGWPLANNLNRALAVEKLPGPGRIGDVVPAAPPGSISMLTDYISYKEQFVTCPNQDTVYGGGYQHVETQPVVIQVPDFGGRFFTYQIADARTESFGELGKQYGTKPGFYLLVGPSWSGAAPEGITAVIHSPTDLVAIFPRVFQDDTPEDKAAIQPFLNQIMVYPLTAFDGKMKTMDWKSTPAFPAPPSTGGETKWVDPERFFDQLPVVMKQVPPLPGEESLYKTFQSVLDAAAKDPKLKAVLTQTAVAAEKDLIKPLFDFHNNGKPIGNGWNSPSNGAHWGYDYLSRAATGKSNMYDNAPQETRYIYTDFDSSALRLNGTHAYTVTFPKGQTPPVDGFWSLTLYNKQHLFSPNSLNRFSLGTKSKSMKLGDDGSLTIYVQSTSPGADREANWLPAPNGDFSLYIRAYWPKSELTEGRWTPPRVEKAK